MILATFDDVYNSVMHIVNYQILYNEIWRLGALLGVVLAAMLAGKILSFFLIRQAEKMDAIEGRFILLSMIVKSMAKPLALFMFGVGLYLSRYIINMTIESRTFLVATCNTITLIAVTWFIFRLVDIIEHFLTRWTSKTDTTLDDQLVPLIRKSLRVVVVIMAGLFIAENVFQWDIGALIAGLGIGGLAFALAAKDMISNLFGSAAIFADRPFMMGERIKVKGVDGTVEEVGFRSTKIRTLDGHLVSVPNGVVANETIENISRRPSIKKNLEITVTYNTSPEKIERGVAIIKEMLEVRKGYFPPDQPGRAHFINFNADSLGILVTYWFAPPDWAAYLEFTHEFNMELLRRFNEEGIEFAFPTQTLYMKQDSPLSADVRVLPIPPHGEQ